jgi:hypothetical protein
MILQIPGGGDCRGEKDSACSGAIDRNWKKPYGCDEANMADRPEAIALEDEDPHAYVGAEAFPPIDTGRGPADEDLDPREGLTAEEEEEEEALASAGDEELSEAPDQ